VSAEVTFVIQCENINDIGAERARRVFAALPRQPLPNPIRCWLGLAVSH
jgi:hypothetical protein